MVEKNEEFVIEKPELIGDVLTESWLRKLDLKKDDKVYMKKVEDHLEIGKYTSDEINTINKTDDAFQPKLLKIVKLGENMDYHEIAKAIGNSLEDTMLDQISPVDVDLRNKFNAVAIKRKDNQLIIGYCRYEEFN